MTRFVRYLIALGVMLLFTTFLWTWLLGLEWNGHALGLNVRNSFSLEMLLIVAILGTVGIFIICERWANKR